jgi:hypothetical protein
MQRERISILWSGGWDEYDVDFDDTVEDTTPKPPIPGCYTSELKVDGKRYVRMCFLRGKRRDPARAVRVLAHRGGGD